MVMTSGVILVVLSVVPKGFYPGTGEESCAARTTQDLPTETTDFTGDCGSSHRQYGQYNIY